MEPMNIDWSKWNDAAYVITTIATIIKTVLTGGPLYWIATAILLIGAGTLVFFLRNYIKKAAKKTSENIAANNDIKQREEEKRLSEEINQGSKEADDIRSQFPDEDKKEHPDKPDNVED